MRAIIPVAGYGTRLRPHTYSLPKVLLNVAGKPILGHILDKLLEQNITEATIVTGYMGDMIQEWAAKNYPMNFSFITQEQPLGLGHAIWCARQSFASQPLFIILGDTIFDVKLSQALSDTRNSIGVKEVADPRRFGVVELEAGRISRLVEKPEKPASNLAIVGLYNIADSDLLASCLDTIVSGNVRTKNEFQLTDALQLMIDRGADFSTFPVEAWYDCGKPETMLDTNRHLLDKHSQSREENSCVIVPPVFISTSANISRSVIGPYATVAAGAVVEDSHVRNSIVSDGATVARSLLEDSIIGNNASVRGNFNRLNVGDSSEINYGA